LFHSRGKFVGQKFKPADFQKDSARLGLFYERQISAAIGNGPWFDFQFCESWLLAQRGGPQHPDSPADRESRVASAWNVCPVTYNTAEKPTVCFYVISETNSEDIIVPLLPQIQPELASVRSNEACHAHMIDGRSARSGALRERFVVLNKAKIREYYRHADVCEREAAAQTDPALRKDFLDTAARWVKLAKSCEFQA
jgi:hypothetical protein